MQSGIATAESLESLQEILNISHDLKNYRKHKKAHHTQKKRRPEQNRTHSKTPQKGKNAPHRNRHRADKWN